MPVHNPTALFCGSPCRTRFNNRRKARGAELYDLVMAWRFERGKTDVMQIRGLIGRLASAYRDSDKTLRDGRQSWILTNGIDRIPLGYSKADGDKR